MANLIALNNPFRLKRPAPFKLNAINLNGAAFFINAVFLLTAAFLFAQPQPLKFAKHQIASESYETVGVFDVDNDNLVDIVSGAYWYKGPEFQTRHYIGSAKRYGEYYDDFSTIPLDVNGDGLMDFITGGWFGKQLVWKQNPGDAGEWQEHLIAEAGNIESTRSWDLDGDGIIEIVPNTPNDSLVIYRLQLDSNKKGTGMLSKHSIFGPHGHGLGFGDINSDGLTDIIVAKGWLQAPEDTFTGEWKMHNDFELGTASVPIIVADVNKDGLSDLIVGQGHDYGLSWYEQKPAAKKQKTQWIKHAIDPYNSQYHSMEWTDIDQDGENELITGKRYRAHNGKDPGGNDELGLYYFKWNGENFSKQVIDYGPYGRGKGTGVYFSVSDVDNNGMQDIIVAGKDGLNIYYNEPIKQ
ncbi:FG-GAP repeat domain-containing protein [Arenibacter echinorum]|uniref:VCBS repeat protein n=1 Tax=Arenibacter echinorum TaxID=440515 RepID=A0A327RQF6_9FLAO|nr:VCBS repeat-containing protein [Arenibacter echinorum]RAJ15947.1 VCBS repeat protein [Arenibacter echinorum]